MDNNIFHFFRHTYDITWVLKYTKKIRQLNRSHVLESNPEVQDNERTTLFLLISNFIKKFYRPWLILQTVNCEMFLEEFEYK